MFERRLKIILLTLSAVIAVLIGRALQLQMVQRRYWMSEAAEALQKVRYLETTRGAIVDFHGRELAVDRPCVDACVDYRALLPRADDKWLDEVVSRRLHARFGEAWRSMPRLRRKALRDQERLAAQHDIDAMWNRLAVLGNRTPEDIEQIRQTILQRVQMRKKYVWFHNYEEAMRKQGVGNGGATTVPADTQSRLEKWLSGGEADDDQQIDKFTVTVAEEMMPHVILHAIPLEVQNELGRYIDKFPGLVLRPGTHRRYPYDSIACHLLGHLGKVTLADIKSDPERANRLPNPLRMYMPNDEVGRDGLESLAEPALRGTLGRVTSRFGEDRSDVTEQPIPGQTVRTTIDIDLQEEIQSFFASATLHIREGGVERIERGAELHGAAVLIDVKTNQVRALVSYPTYDPNEYEEKSAEWFADELNGRMRNRATESQFEPGSTVKPLVGLSAITNGTIKVNAGVECTGYLTLPDHDHHDRLVPLRWGRCWVASTYAKLLNNAVAHHPVPVPHQGHDGNPDGFLTYSDALERSCNVYFETVADRMGMDALDDWMGRFGLGRKTGIGIEEVRGRGPRGLDDIPHGWGGRARCFLAGIGQANVAATPIQMANVAATIARNGIWMRPKLIIPNDPGGSLPAVRSGVFSGPDEVDLHLDPQALQACRLGMTNVVNGRAGTGKGAHMDEILVAGKTGTAQATAFGLLIRDEHGKPSLDAHQKRQYTKIDPSMPGHPNPDAPWYRSSADGKLDHSWMIGFAPADDPKIAFAVLVEYGGSGGGAAADVAKAALEACIAHNYLTATPRPARPTEDNAEARAAAAADHDLEDHAD